MSVEFDDCPRGIYADSEANIIVEMWHRCIAITNHLLCETPFLLRVLRVEIYYTEFHEDKRRFTEEKIFMELNRTTGLLN